MKPDTISLRRRHLMMAGLAAPAALYAVQISGVAAAENTRLVLSGRLLDASGRPLSGARVEILHPHTRELAGADTDADGRFLIESANAGANSVHYRISSKGYARSARLEARNLQRDETGAWRGTVGVALA